MTTNPINKEPVNESRNDEVQQTDDDDDDDDEQLPFSLTLGSKSYSSKIRPKTSPVRKAPPPEFAGPMTTWPTPADLLAARSMPPYPTPPPHLIPSWMSDYPDHQRPNPPQLFTNFFPPSSFAPTPSNLTTPPAIRPVTASVRGYRSQSTANQKSGTISPPFPWATNYRGQIQSLEYLESKQITTITGEVQCRHCENVYPVSYNLKERFAEVEKIFLNRKRIMRERAPSIWLNPEQRRCELCGREKAVKPVIAERKSQINWLFLLLGQTLGFCTLEQLKNFCKHSKSHRTGAKDRVLYLTYLGLCKMLQPKCDLFTRDSTGSKR
ncbi:unnamed protein product [Arabidopsis lyrata]|uniref:uncharacterized protein LOC9327553 n=1 Tax=Arabidopsis lyrata subsp. lyrata TaxID=81972 RepID=UPI000A29CFDD|nr:uncharacterized protein LOC9327553 [Arabidopsis lyrata subsp. lyrata]CAH8255025.1 unnamed protein product [Arabidopsis lyrata]|eukprot:XP_020866806.1 uncharacterized protein LOC9327553 [Arabidopsis lyrata subsp. lyrata]